MQAHASIGHACTLERPCRPMAPGHAHSTGSASLPATPIAGNRSSDIPHRRSDDCCPYDVHYPYADYLGDTLKQSGTSFHVIIPGKRLACRCIAQAEASSVCFTARSRTLDTLSTTIPIVDPCVCTTILHFSSVQSTVSISTWCAMLPQGLRVISCAPRIPRPYSTPAPIMLNQHPLDRPLRAFPRSTIQMD